MERSSTKQQRDSPQDPRDRGTLVQVRFRQAGHRIHRSKVRLGSHPLTGTWRRKKSTTPTLVTDPHDEQPTDSRPREGTGSSAVTVEVAATGSWLGVVSE